MCQELETKLKELHSRTANLPSAQGSGSGANRDQPSTSKRQEGDSGGQLPKRRRSYKEADGEGRTALHWAAWRGETEKVKLLLEGGWDTRARNSMLSTPLHEALRRGKEATAEVLLEADFMMDGADRCGWTPLHAAAGGGCVAAIGKLLAAGADSSLTDSQGRTPLHRALLDGREAAAELLLGATPELDRTDTEGRTPLHDAASRGYARIVRELLSRGVRPHVRSDEGVYPLQYAVWGGHDEVVRMLLAAYALRDVRIDWAEMELRRKQKKKRCIKLLSDCRAEICRMKDTRVEGSGVSFYDVATRHTSRVARRLSAETIRRLLLSDHLVERFPVYGELLSLKLRELEERRFLSDRCRQCFSLLARPLPLTCTDIILPCLTDEDMRNFIRAFGYEFRRCP
ncbi:kinase D-interacting substrate of 220 kDa B-like [Uloborus diversus]|uniref:kinase D-interacting substrate of 220 kDa B-like n=1 Tax=Uloborus diversus TaxID=327109 RepID=UPI00240A8439|nr:kinase D-interacting substrate of 220 kDa B-like [Uloborus diversus]